MIHNRKLNPIFDSKPSVGHRLNLKLSLPYIKNKHVLDVGCWAGQFEQLALKHVSKITGIDPEKEAIDYAKKQIPTASFKVGSALKIPYPNASFDAVVFCDVIEHLPINTEKKALKEISRVLKSNGKLILATPNSHILSILLDPAYFLIGHRHYSLDTLYKMLTATGFRVVSTYQSAGIFRLLSSFIDALSKKFTNKKFVYPDWFKNKIENELFSGGFAQNHIIAQKLP
ncbi:MAG: class I SAM-dependent methyltransferase [Patescibacteria group bacterium]